MKILLGLICLLAVFGFWIGLPTILLGLGMGPTAHQEAFRIGNMTFSWMVTAILGFALLCGVVVAKVKG